MTIVFFLKRRSIVFFEICRFIYDICYNAHRHDSGIGSKIEISLLGGKFALRVFYIPILYNIVYKLHLKYTFLRCLTMGSMACYQYMRSVHNRGLLVISVSHLLSRVGAGIVG